MPVTVKITGLDKALPILKLLGDGAKEVGRTHLRISSGLPYAHWIEEGFYAGGRPGRTRAAHMLQAGLDTMTQLAPDAVARNVDKGATVVQHALSGVAARATDVARQRTPVVSGNLRASIHSTTLGRGD